MMKIHKFQIPDSTMHEDDRIFLAIGFNRPRQTSYAEAWRIFAARAGRDPAFARLVRAAINKFVSKTRRKTGWDSTERSLNKITSEDLAVFKRQFGKHCKPTARRSRRRYAQEFAKPIEQFTLDDLRQMAKPNGDARNYLGKVWHLLTKAEQRRVELMNPFALEATGGEVIDWDVYFASRLSRLLKRKIHPPKKNEEGENVEIHRPT
jgi:alkanesulfonate monooxygenase SsuD/methylene tetrahydromethanopterin reductase-like flavin-dependent oxidoreductase (luciferase family)